SLGGAYNNRAAAYIQTRRFELALADAMKAIELRPLLEDAHANLAAALVSLKRYDEAVDAATRALQMNPKDDVAYLHRANAYLGLGKNRDLMISDFKSVIRLAPNSDSAKQATSVLSQIERDTR